MNLYAIVKFDGSIRRSKRSKHLMIYQHLMTARRAALSDGDAVVEVELDLSKEPVFIRRRVVSG